MKKETMRWREWAETVSARPPRRSAVARPALRGQQNFHKSARMWENANVAHYVQNKEYEDMSTGTPLDRDPIDFEEETPTDDLGIVELTFRGKPEGIWKHTWKFSVDKATAAEIRKYCQDRKDRAMPVYQRDVMETYGVPPN